MVSQQKKEFQELFSRLNTSPILLSQIPESYSRYVSDTDESFSFGDIPPIPIFNSPQSEDDKVKRVTLDLVWNFLDQAIGKSDWEAVAQLLRDERLEHWQAIDTIHYLVTQLIS